MKNHTLLHYLPSPKWGAITLTFTVSAPIKQAPVFS